MKEENPPIGSAMGLAPGLMAFGLALLTAGEPAFAFVSLLLALVLALLRSQDCAVKVRALVWPRWVLA